MTQVDLARATGLHRTAIGLIETGRRTMLIDTLARIADALDSEPADFLRRQDRPPG